MRNLPLMQATQETQIRSLDQEDPPEEGMATHTCSLVWRILWTAEPCMESQRMDITVDTGNACIHIFKNGLELGNVESNKNTYSGWSEKS